MIKICTFVGMKTAEFSLQLLEWYAENGRDLPWRRTTDPYHIWVSEIILQQTRVAQGYDYFLRFIRRFPTVESLACAAEDEVMHEWQGLGYYSRARNLHAAACQILALGHFPDTFEGIRGLKGVGDYTAAAIASLAFGLPHAVVDGNVYRVLSRYFGISTPIDSTAGKKLFSALAQDLLVVSRPAAYNQAIMDFGALQCTPKSPLCSSCPLADSCQALLEGRVELLPVKQHQTRVRDRFFTYVYVRCAGKVLLQKRGGGDIWQGLYQVPMLEGTASIPLHAVEDWAGQYGLLTLLRSNVVHQLSHQRLHADFYLLECAVKPPFEGVWVDETERGLYAVPRLIEDLMKAVFEV